MVLDLAKNRFRQGEILEILLSNGWDYMRQLLAGSKPDEPELPPPAVLRNILTDLGPVYVKLGQLLSTRPDLLPAEYIAALSSLQADVPPVEWEKIEAIIRQELPLSLEETFSEIDPQPLAAGSIAQVHRAKLKDGRVVAIKVQRPGIDAIVDRDIDLIKDIAKLVAVTDFGKSYDVVSLAEEFGSALQAELNFTIEAGYTERLKRNLAQSPWFDPQQLAIPQIDRTLTRKKLLVMEYLDGVPLLAADLPDNNNTQRQAITTLLFRAFFQQFLTDGFFHADPHPGNLFYLADGRIAILDCGMMGFFDPRTRKNLTEIILAIVSVDAARCTQLTLEIAEPTKPVDLAKLEADYARLLRRYAYLSLGQFNTSQALYEVLQAARRNHLRWPGNIGLFAKALANLEGVGRQFNPAVNVIEEVKPLMTDLFRQQLLGDDALQTFLRTVLELKNLSLESPRQVGFLLDRLSTETLKFKFEISGLESMRRSINDAANRRSFSTVVGSLVIGAAILSTGEPTPQVQLLSEVLFTAASLVGVWLIVSMLRSGLR
jgi:predicted unusual protein kinase regulating ubiquinone biosynthesis (AarF/ABC1/UbiB family)